MKWLRFSYSYAFCWPMTWWYDCFKDIA